jgi:formate hydrogenlyase transcriptional activator
VSIVSIPAEDANLCQALEARLRFETLLVDLSSRFIDVPPGEVDREIEDALRRVCELLGFDMAVLWQWSGADPDVLTATHYHHGPGGLPPPEPLRQEHYPWYIRQMLAGHVVAARSLDDLPAEAAVDVVYGRLRGIKSNLCLPLSLGSEPPVGALAFSTAGAEHDWPDEVVTRLKLVAQVFVNALFRRRHELSRRESEAALRQSYAEIERLKDRLQAESEYLRAEIGVALAQGEITGQSAAIKQVLRLVEQVAPTDSSVLIHGETGTGKELIAQAIHRLSPRRRQVMVKVNCAALPAGLVESELFGREKGAFTGALSRQVGRFELADGSTVFLDEVGEFPPEVQVKLLRVLQEGEFERLGSPRTVEVDVRVIAATHRDLVEDIRKGRFREDLYYRLNVFPIRMPPLRERAEDIPLLVWAFLEEFSTRMGKKITHVPRATMDALQRHPWPGNVRQLRNVIEHGAIITTGDTLRIPALGDGGPGASRPQTLADAERDHILRALEATRWRVKGPRGAAAALGLNPSTLRSRMKKLGIQPPAVAPVGERAGSWTSREIT